MGAVVPIRGQAVELKIQAITDLAIFRNEGSGSTGHTGRRATG
jgi:hypothetical protein